MEKIMNKALTFLLAIIASTAWSAHAQQWDEKQTEVWGVVLDSYKDIENKDSSWSDKWLTEDAMAWGNGTPLPRNRDSIKIWDKFNFADGSNNKVSDYSPAAIVVHDSTAVVHYYYSNGVVLKNGENKTVHGRCTDILVKDAKSWKFVGWHCSDEE